MKGMTPEPLPAKGRCVAEAGFIPVMPRKVNRKEPWEYNRELYLPAAGRQKA